VTSTLQAMNGQIAAATEADAGDGRRLREALWEGDDHAAPVAA
jgi:hypothetical protein